MEPGVLGETSQRHLNGAPQRRQKAYEADLRGAPIKPRKGNDTRRIFYEKDIGTGTCVGIDGSFSCWLRRQNREIGRAHV